MMLTLKKLSTYTPDYAAFDAIYLQTNDGLDWYYHRTRFQVDTLKICIDDNNVIRMFDYNAELLWPDGLSVTEVPTRSVPDNLTVDGCWQYINGKIVPRVYTQEEWEAWAESEKSRRMAVSNTAIAPLQDATDIGIATNEEAVLLLEWKKYRVLLSRLDTSKAPGIEWPAAPIE